MTGFSENSYMIYIWRFLEKKKYFFEDNTLFISVIKYNDDYFIYIKR